MTTHTETHDHRGVGDKPVLPTLREVEAGHIAHVLAVVGGNQRRAARALGITRWSLARRVKKYGLPVPQPEAVPGPAPTTNDGHSGGDEPPDAVRALAGC